MTHVTGAKVWLLAIRPRTLPMAIAPVLAGTALAQAKGGHVDGGVLLCAALGALGIQAGTNLWNDHADGLAGADQSDRLGPPRVTALGLAGPAQVARAAVLAFALAALAGLYLVWLGGWPILALGIASLFCGWAYSGGPWPLSHTPLSELFVIVFFGLAATLGTAWLMGGRLDGQGVALGLALGLPAAAVLMANNHRDRASDARAGRKTLALLLGARGSVAAFGLFLILAMLCLAQAPFGALGGLIAAPVMARQIWRFATLSPSPAFNQVLARTAQSQLLMALGAAVGIWVLL